MMKITWGELTMFIVDTKYFWLQKINIDNENDIDDNNDDNDNDMIQK